MIDGGMSMRPGPVMGEKPGAYWGGQAVQLLGLLLCFVVFPVGLIVGVCLLIVGGRMSLAGSRRGRCPFCRGWVDKQAVVCEHCRSELGPAARSGKSTAWRVVQTVGMIATLALLWWLYFG